MRRYKDTEYPTVQEISMAVAEYVRTKCAGAWPEDDWLSVGKSWSINVWDDDGKRRIAVYRDRVTDSGFLETDCDAAVVIQ